MSEDKSKKDSIILTVYNQKNELIRTLKEKAPKESGVERIYWQLHEKGAKRPSRKSNKSTSESRGVSVLPGDYKLVLQYQDAKDSTSITVKYDPRIPISQDVLQEKYKLEKQLEAKMDLAYRSLEQLHDSKKIVNSYKKQTTDIDKKKYEDIIKASDSISKKIE